MKAWNVTGKYKLFRLFQGHSSGSWIIFRVNAMNLEVENIFNSIMVNTGDTGRLATDHLLQSVVFNNILYFNPTHFHIKKNNFKWFCVTVRLCMWMQQFCLLAQDGCPRKHTEKQGDTVWNISMMHKQSSPPPSQGKGELCGGSPSNHTIWPWADVVPLSSVVVPRLTVAIDLWWLRSSKPSRQGWKWQAQRTIYGNRPVIMWL